MAPRKKICTKCGRKLWLRDFYSCNSDNPASPRHSTYCKECERQYKNEHYAATKKIADGRFFHPSYGRVMEHKGMSLRIAWSGDMLSILTRYYPRTKNEEVAELCGVSVRTMIRKAKELGLVKDSEWLRGVWEENRFLAHVESKRKGYPGTFKKGNMIGVECRFKKKVV